MFFKSLMGPGAQVVALDGVRAPVPQQVPSFLEGSASTWWGRVRDLLLQMLAVEPAARPTAQQVCWHPSLQVSLAGDIHEEGNFLTRREKIDRLNERLRRIMRSDARDLLSARRATILQDGLRHFARPGRDYIRCSLLVRFVGEAGVDLGGLRKDFFTCFFDELISPEHGFFERRSGAGGVLPTVGSSSASPDRLAKFESIGRALLKALLEGIL